MGLEATLNKYNIQFSFFLPYFAGDYYIPSNKQHLQESIPKCMERFRREFWRANYPIMPGVDFTIAPTITGWRVIKGITDPCENDVKEIEEEAKKENKETQEHNTGEKSKDFLVGKDIEEEITYKAEKEKDEKEVLHQNEESTNSEPFTSNNDDQETTTVNRTENIKQMVIILCHSDTTPIAEKLKTSIERNIFKDVEAKINTSFEIVIVTQEDHQNASLDMFDQCHLIVPLLSPAFLQCAFLVEQLNTAVYRHRFQQRIVSSSIIVEKLKLFPVYPALGLCFFSLLDEFWATEFVDNDASKLEMNKDELSNTTSSNVNAVEGLELNEDTKSVSTNAKSVDSNDPENSCESTDDDGNVVKQKRAIYRCLETAGCVFANILVHSPIASSSFKTVMSVAECTKWYKADPSERESLKPLCFFSNAKITSSRFVAAVDGSVLSKSTQVNSEGTEEDDGKLKVTSQPTSISSSSLLNTSGCHQIHQQSQEEIPAPSHHGNDNDNDIGSNSTKGVKETEQQQQQQQSDKNKHYQNKENKSEKESNPKDNRTTKSTEPTPMEGSSDGIESKLKEKKPISKKSISCTVT